jgi:anti-sigma B factor antagonist
MTVNTTEESNRVIVEIVGEVDLYNAPKVRDTINELMDKDKINIIIDLDEVDYIDSSGIGVLISSATDIKDLGGTLKLKCNSPNVKRVFELTRLVDFFDIVSTID